MKTWKNTLCWSLASFIGIPYMIYIIKMLKDMEVHLKPYGKKSYDIV
ncbi:MAG: hypothetical protein QXE61_07705 [Nitrososphaerota archaeon]